MLFSVHEKANQKIHTDDFTGSRIYCKESVYADSVIFI